MRLLSLVSLSFFLAHCASYTDEIKAMRDDFVGSHYSAALEKMDKSSLRESQKNRLLFHMEKAMILDRMGKLQDSRALLSRADQIADELYTVSITKTAATFIVNESVADYAGEDYEKVAIHTIMALSYLEEGTLKEARVEAKKISLKLAEITQKYDPQHAGYKEDAFALFLSGIIFEALEQWDDAIIDYRQAFGLFSSSAYSKFYEGPIPPSLVTSLYGVAKKRNRSDVLKDLKDRFPDLLAKADGLPKGGDLVVIHEAGNIVTKTAKDFVLPISGQIIRFSFPVIEKKKIAWQNTINGVNIDGVFHDASNLANMNGIAYQCLEDRRGRLILKSAARLITKAKLVDEAHKNFGPLGGIAANIFAAATETADTRSWTFLPQAFYITRVRLSPGKHDLEIKTAGRISQMQTVDVKEGEITLLRSK
ncbi:MAG: hypothetical protein HYW48_06120 [Deltaproteobacteria bacterium]|nr:hypothetical protein [Deltaproteobacteria bacterium]